MRRTDVPATKSNLLRLREHLEFVRAGHELLEQKREVLLEELLDVHREAGALRRATEAALAAAYRSLAQALLAGGRALLEREALAEEGTQRLRARERSVMGVVVPLLELEVGGAGGPAAAPGWSPPAAARVGRQVRALLPGLARLAEIEVSCLRLGTELRATQRKVNALENVFIPEYRDTIHFIEGSLDEREREALFQRKRVKARQTGGAAEE